MTTAQIYERLRWPEFRLDIPETVNLKCPECGAVIACDVTIDEDAGGAVMQGVAVAAIEVDSCEECRVRLCPKCPSGTIDGLRYCPSCHEAEGK